MAAANTAIAATEQPSSNKQVRIQLSTNHADFALKNDVGPVLVDTNLRRRPLSILVNHLLGNTDGSSTVPFEFMINGTVLRSSIEEFLNSNGINTETVLQLEYFPALLPPKYADSFEHDSWISSVDCQESSSTHQPLIASGSHDGLFRIWNTSKQVLATSEYLGDTRATAVIKAIRFLSLTRIATGGYDRTVRLWDFSAPTSIAETGSTKHIADLHHHKQMVTSLAVDEPTQRLLSASNDHTLALWSTDLASAPVFTPSEQPIPAAKKQKKMTTVEQVAPLSSLAAHTNHVTSTIFSPSAPDQAYSVSADSTLKTWSLATASVADNRQLSDPLYSITALTNMHLLAVGSSKGDITLLDPRASTASVKVRTIRQAHNQGFIHSLSPNPKNHYYFASGGMDGLVKTWDIRGLGGANAVLDPKKDGNGKGGPIFVVQWTQDIGILAGGADSQLRIYQ